MNQILLICLFLISSFSLLAQQSRENLELISINQLDPSFPSRFDLSGLTQDGERFYAVADKSHDRFIYEIEFKNSYWFIKDKIRIDIGKKLDLEGIDNCNGDFYLIDERSSSIYLYKDGKWSEFLINSEEHVRDLRIKGKNNGLEGIALDCANNFLYLAKERQPRYLLKISLEDGTVIKKFNIPETDSNDYADLSIENGFMYVLERNAYLISKVDLNSLEVVSKFSFRNICSEQGDKLYEPAKYGMAEALLITEDEIWIGLDNNSLNASDFGRDTYGLTGNKPAILKFKRPDNF